MFSGRSQRPLFAPQLTSPRGCCAAPPAPASPRPRAAEDGPVSSSPPSRPFWLYLRVKPVAATGRSCDPRPRLLLLPVPRSLSPTSETAQSPLVASLRLLPAARPAPGAGRQTAFPQHTPCPSAAVDYFMLPKNTSPPFHRAYHPPRVISARSFHPSGSSGCNAKVNRALG